MVHAIATPRKVGTIRFGLMPLVGCLQTMQFITAHPVV